MRLGVQSAFCVDEQQHEAPARPHRFRPRRNVRPVKYAADHRQVAESADRHLEKQNDELVDTLAAQVSTLKSVRQASVFV